MNGLQAILRRLPRIIVTGLLQISLPVRLGPRQGIINLRATEVMTEAEVEAEVEAGVEEMPLAVEELPTLALVVELEKKRLSLVDCCSANCSVPSAFTPIPTKHDTFNCN